MTTFFQLTAERLAGNNRIVQIGRMIDWEKMRYRFKKMNKCKVGEEVGQKPYDVMKMVRAMVLQQWHGLSDPGLEEALYERMSFLLFSGFNPDEGIPDETTICRFRNRLAEKKLDKVLLRLINEQLESKGLKVKESRGAVVDATIIESSCRPRRVIEIQPDREEQESSSPEAMVVEESKDTEAKWIKKGKKSQYGYKAFMRTDVEDGYIESLHVESANVSEMKHLKDAIDQVFPGRRVYADKAYGWKEDRDLLKEKQLKDGLMYKAVRGKALTHWQKVFNRLVSKERYIVEQSFGTIKRRFSGQRSSYRGKRKTETQWTLKAVCLNLLKGYNVQTKLQKIPIYQGGL